MKDTSSHVEQQQMMTDIERATLITSDINNEKHLSEQAYNMLLLDIKRRYENAELNHHEYAIEESASQAAEGVAWTLDEINEFSVVEQLEHLDHVEHAVKGSESFLDKLGPVGLLIANGIGLLVTPWRCYREKRWPTRDEWIKLGLCAATIIFVAVALAFPLIGAGFFIAAVAFGVIKSVQNIRIKQEELQRLKQRTQVGLEEIQRLQDEIQQLNVDISKLEKEQDPTATQSVEHSNKCKRLSVCKQRLTRVTDQYVQHGYGIHQLKEALEHPIHSLLHKIHVAMSAVALIGAIVFIFFPPVGALILIAAGVVSLTAILVFAVSKWFANRSIQSPEKPLTHNPTEQPGADNGEKSERNVLQHVHDPHLDSTAKEITQLQAGPASVDPKETPPIVTASVPHLPPLFPAAEAIPAAPQPSPAPDPSSQDFETVDRMFKSTLIAKEKEQQQEKAVGEEEEDEENDEDLLK